MDVAEFLSRCTFSRLTPELQASCKPFKCGNDDLDDFFGADYLLYGRKLLGKTYVYFGFSTARKRTKPRRWA